jgi:hypothetical protein
MRTIFDTMFAQASELLRSEIIQGMINDCQSQEEKCMKLAIATMLAMAKSNQIQEV